MTKRLLTLTSQTEKCKELLFQRHKENVQLFFLFKSGERTPDSDDPFRQHPAPHSHTLLPGGLRKVHQVAPLPCQPLKKGFDAA